MGLLENIRQRHYLDVDGT